MRNFKIKISMLLILIHNTTSFSSIDKEIEVIKIEYENGNVSYAQGHFSCSQTKSGEIMCDQAVSTLRGAWRFESAPDSLFIKLRNLYEKQQLNKAKDNALNNNKDNNKQ